MTGGGGPDPAPTPEGAGAGDPGRPGLDARQLDFLFEMVDRPIVVLDRVGRIVHASCGVEAAGFVRAELAGRHVLDLVHEDERNHLVERMARWLDRPAAGPGPTVRIETPADGWVDVALEAITDPDLAPYSAIVAFDVLSGAPPPPEDPRRLAWYEQRLARVAASFVHLPSHRIDDGIRSALAELGAFEGVDRVCLVQFDRERSELLNTHEWTAPGVASFRDRDHRVPVTEAPVLQALRRFEPVHVPSVADLGGDWRREQRFWQSRQTVSVAAVPLVDDGQFVGFVGFEAVRREQRWDDHHIAALRSAAGIIGQALARREAERRLAHQARHDSLTGLANRWELLERLERAVALLQPNFGDAEGDARPGRDSAGDTREDGGRHDLASPGGIALTVFDVDRFKVVNDSLGHRGGDLLLRAVARRCSAVCVPGETLARLGGDELVLLSTDVQDPTEALARAEALRATLAEPFVVDGHEAHVQMSAGVVFVEEPVAVPDQLLGDADAAMYEAKARGRDQVVLFDEVLARRLRDRLRLESELRRGVAGDQLEVHYQPEVDLVTGRVVGAEALLRWRHPTRGLLSAAAFLGLAEETGVILDLGPLVLAEACGVLARWLPLVTDADFRVRVNLSARQLGQPDLVQVVEAAVASASVPAGALCLEITETTVMADAEVSLAVLEKLRGLGVEIAVDDFGTGYSSLEYLKRLPVDVLKIDRSFVDGLGSDPDDTAIVTAVVGLARAMGLGVTAEGVETGLQREELVRLGCTRAQGFLLGRAMPADEFEARLRR